MENYQNLSLEDLPNEEWKEFSLRYCVSNLGRVKGNTRKGLKIIKQVKNTKTGKLAVTVYEGNKKTFHVQRMVAQLFVNNLENKPCVLHIDRNGLNNIYTNLIWATRLEQQQYGKPRGAKIQPIRHCKKCGNLKTRSVKNGQYTRCDYCNSQRSSLWAKANKPTLKETRAIYRRNNKEKLYELQKCYRLKTKYGLSKDQYSSMKESQDNRCAICGTNNFTGNGKTLVIDHCHDTMKVRGLLCDNCNVGIGRFKDNIHFLASAISYLSQHKQEKIKEEIYMKKLA